MNSSAPNIIPSDVEERFASLSEYLKSAGMNEKDIRRIQKAFDLAQHAHEGQKRLSGEPYIIHPIEVAKLLSELGLDASTIMAGLLHDVFEDTSLSREELEKEMGRAVLHIIEGVTAVSKQQMKAVLRENEKIRKLATLRKLLIASVRDVRVLLVKLADRLHNMRTIQYLSDEAQTRIAQETMNIYAPVAHRLGIYRWKMELEDLSFAVLLPVEYECLKQRIAKTQQEREREIKELIAYMQTELQRLGIKARILGRPKHLYSTYRKMQRQQIPLERVMDLYAIRVIVSTVEECYSVLDIAHQLGNLIPERFRDHIKKPRSNGYRSLHTTVFIPRKYPLEIQIRTEEMDREAEFGIAAHWFYKEGGIIDDARLQRHIEWLRNMAMELSSADGELITLKDIQDDLKISEIFAFTPKGDVIELPLNSTVLDFAYSIHTDIGNHCIGARINGKFVPIHTRLNTGDVVEILTSPKQEPRLGWLKLVNFGRARNKIRRHLRERGILPKEEEEEELTKKEEKKEMPPQPLFIPDLSVLTKTDFANKNETLEKERHLSIRIDGEKNISVQFSKCCNPLPGDEVLGYSTVKGAITIHKKDCRVFNSVPRDTSRIHKAWWESDNISKITIHVLARPSPTIIQEITTLLIENKIPVIDANYKSLRHGLIKFEFTQNIMPTASMKSSDYIIRSIRSINGVIQVRRTIVSI